MIGIGSDHAGYPLKEQLIAFLEKEKIAYRDFGCASANARCDYPDIAQAVCEKIVGGECDKGVLICGTGIGISMAANKIDGIRAALCHDCFSTKYTRLHNDANVICFGARVMGAGLACELLDIFLKTGFEGGRHQVRVDKIMNLEKLN